jgi:hypothetical protein
VDNGQYRNLLDARSQISSITWTVFSVFGAGLAILANGVVAASSQQPRSAATLAGIGLFASVLWLALQLRLHAYVRFYYRLIHHAEETLRIDSQFRLAATPKSPVEPEFRYLPHASTIAMTGIVIVIALWASAFTMKLSAVW